MVVQDGLFTDLLDGEEFGDLGMLDLGKGRIIVQVILELSEGILIIRDGVDAEMARLRSQLEADQRL